MMLCGIYEPLLFIILDSRDGRVNKSLFNMTSIQLLENLEVQKHTEHQQDERKQSLLQNSFIYTHPC